MSNEGRCFSVLSRACDKEKLSNPHEEWCSSYVKLKAARGWCGGSVISDLLIWSWIELQTFGFCARSNKTKSIFLLLFTRTGFGLRMTARVIETSWIVFSFKVEGLWIIQTEDLLTLAFMWNRIQLGITIVCTCIWQKYITSLLHLLESI